MKKFSNRLIIAIIIAAFALFSALPLFAATLTNKDIEKMKKGNQKNPPRSQANHSGASSNNAGVPSAPGIAPIPPPASSEGGGAAIIKKHLPYKEWKDEYKDYFVEHYNDASLKLKPRLIVLHYSGTDNFAGLWWTFVKGGVYEGKNGHLSVHYVVDRDGTIYELMPPNFRARSTYGVNHAAISIDLIGRSEISILNNKKQMEVSFALVRWLMKKYKISKEKVFSHTEIAKGRELVPEYLDYADKSSPDRYPPDSKTRGPGKSYMYKLRYYFIEHK